MQTNFLKTGLFTVLLFTINALSFGQNPTQQGTATVKKDAPSGSSSSRSVNVIIRNTTAYGLLLASSNLVQGTWTIPPTSIIQTNQTIHVCTSESANGTQGVLNFDVFKDDLFVSGSLSLKWKNPLNGDNTYNWTAPTGFVIQRNDGKGNDASVEFVISEKGSPNFQSPIVLGHTPVTSLSIRVKTAAKDKAGTKNNVYFNVGPMSWRLTKTGNTFERNADETFSLDVSKGNLYADDIVWLKLEKKGNNNMHGEAEGPEGDWEVDFVELTINGQTKIKRVVNRVFSSPKNPFWTSVVQPNKTAKANDIVANTIRFVPNEQTILKRDVACEWTNNFKSKGIGGWLTVDSVETACITGKLVWKPTLSSDAFATIDIQLEQIVINDQTINFTEERPRYIRVKYRLQDCFKSSRTNAALDQLRDGLILAKQLPDIGQRINTCGNFKWDTDDAGHYEVHPILNEIKIL